MKDIQEGYTYEYLTHALFVFIVSIILASSINPVYILFSAIGILLALVKSGIEINSTELKVRKYNSFGSFKKGKWIDLKSVLKIELQYNSNKTKNNLIFRPLYSSSTISTLKTYDLIIENKNSSHTLNQFN